MATQEPNNRESRNRRERSRRSIPIWTILLAVVFFIVIALICGLIFLNSAGPIQDTNSPTPDIVLTDEPVVTDIPTDTPTDNRETAIAETAMALRTANAAATNNAATAIAETSAAQETFAVETLDARETDITLTEVTTEQPTQDSSTGSVTPTPTPTEEDAASDDPTEVPASATAGCTVRSDWITYVGRAGDTLSSLANRTNSSIAALQEGNCLSGNTIGLGQTLRLPQAPLSTVTPRPGNTTAPPAPPPLALLNSDIAIYSNPFDLNSVLVLAELGLELKVIGRDETGQYIQVRLSDGQIGWLPVDANIELNIPIASLPVIDLPAPTPTPEPTQTEATDEPTEEVTVETTEDVAPTSAPEIAGEVDAIGNASIYPRYNTVLEYPETMPVIVELIFDEWIITPTPRGELMVFEAVQPDVTRPVVIVEVENNPTPPPARAEDKVNNVPAYVIAELDCLDTSFTGCSELDVTQLQLRGVNRWEWTVQSIEGVSGNQNLTLRLYAARADGTKRESTPIWTHNFVVAVQYTLAPTGTNALPLLMMVLIIVALLLAAFFLIRAFLGRRIIADVFISYRRKGGLASARNLHDNLSKRHVDAFFDFEDLHHGRFGENLQREIEERDNFILVLAPDTFESEWVIREAEYALEHDKNIIPVTVEGFDIGTAPFPESLEVIRDFNAVDLSPQYYDAAIDKIVDFLLPKGQKRVNLHGGRTINRSE